MKKKKVVQWTVFLAALLMLFVLAVIGLVSVEFMLMPVLGADAASLLVTIAGWAAGGLVALLGIRSCEWLEVRHGWFV